jgi:hypothetical protein
LSATASYSILIIDKVCYGLRHTLHSLAAGAVSVLLVGKDTSTQLEVPQESLEEFTEDVRHLFAVQSVTLHEVCIPLLI